MSASEHTGTDQPQAKQPVKLLKRSELPIYEVECCVHHETPIKADRSSLEKGIGQIRVACNETLESLKSSQDRLAEIYETGKAHTLDAIAHLREESNVLSRVGAITAGGLSGILLGIRGGFFKKLFYGGIGGSAIASICYPQEATQISKGAFTIAKYYAIIGYNKVREEINVRQEVKSQSSYHQKQELHHVEQVGEQKLPVPPKQQTERIIGISDREISKPAPNLQLKGDYGQSHPEDNDMYTTRG